MSTEMAGQDAPVVVNEAPEVAQIPATTTEAQTDGAEGGNESPAEDRVFTQKELDEIVQKVKAKERAKGERRGFEKAKSLLTQPIQEPKPENFHDQEQFNRAQLEYLAEKKAEEKLAQREVEAEQARMRENLHERMDKAAERYSDFQEVISNPALPINEAMAEFIAESDNGGDVAYFLGKNPAKAAQIAAMSPVKAARELLRIESEVSKAPPPKTVSNAPAPIKPIAARSSGTPSYDTTDPRSIKTMSTSEWIAAENARMMKKLESRYRT